MGLGPDLVAIGAFIRAAAGGLKGDTLLDNGDADVLAVFLVIHQGTVGNRNGFEIFDRRTRFGA